MGVEFRIHTFFVLLAVVCLMFANFAGVPSGSGFALWLLIAFAVAIRELGRLMVAAWLGLRLRTVLLLPIGGLFAYATPESQELADSGPAQYALAAAGPLANLLTALFLAAMLTGISGGFSLLLTPYVTPAALVRSLIWIQARPRPAPPAARLSPRCWAPAAQRRRRLPHDPGPPAPPDAPSSALASSSLSPPFRRLASSTIPCSPAAGFFIFIGAQLEDQGVFYQSVVDTVQMREVMLTDYSTLSPSDTLADALHRCVHSIQEDFPVVRGSQLVGIVNRQRIVETLRADGNGYIQGVMSRTFQVAKPEDTLGAIIRRITAGRGLTLIPVAEGEKIVGMVSVQNLMTSMSLLAEQRKYNRQENEG